MLVSLLRCSRPQIVGHLHILWWWGLDVADRDGVLPKTTSDAAIADVVGWPIDDATALVKALKTSGFMEKRGYKLHDWKDYTWRYYQAIETKTAASESGSFGNHKRWHLDKGVVKADCPHCIAPDIAPETEDGIAPDSRNTSPRRRGDGKPESLPHPPSSPHQSDPSKPTPPQRRRRAAAPDRPLGWTLSRWLDDLVFSGDGYEKLSNAFSGVDVRARFREWVSWIEEDEEERIPKDAAAAFKGWLGKAGGAR